MSSDKNNKGHKLIFDHKQLISNKYLHVNVIMPWCAYAILTIIALVLDVQKQKQDVFWGKNNSWITNVCKTGENDLLLCADIAETLPWSFTIVVFFFKGSPIMMWMKFTRSMTFRICHYGSLAKLRPHIRNVSQGFSYLDSRIHSIQPLCCRSPLLAGHASITLTVGLQPRRTITTDRPSWYESVADSTPVYLTEQLLNSAQQMTGLPWWASIMCTTLALRTTITLPLGIYQSIIIAKVLLDTYMDICLCKIVLALVLLLFFSYIQPFKCLAVVRFFSVFERSLLCSPRQY